MRVPVVDDEEPVAGLMKQGLESDHDDVDVAYDGEQAESIVDESDFDLVTLDLVLPGVDGFDVLNHIRARKPSLPVLILSGWATVGELVGRDEAREPANLAPRRRAGGTAHSKSTGSCQGERAAQRLIRAPYTPPSWIESLPFGWPKGTNQIRSRPRR